MFASQYCCFFHATFCHWDHFGIWYMVYGIWYVVYGIKMTLRVYSLIFHMCHAWAVYNVVHLFFVIGNMPESY